MLDPTKDAIDLDATHVEMSAREKQNKHGQKHIVLPAIGESGFISIIAVTSQVKPTAEQWFSVLQDLQEKVGVTGMQAMYEMAIMQPEDGYQNNLHTSAHVRQDAI
jgi:hypothetical protein